MKQLITILLMIALIMILKANVTIAQESLMELSLQKAIQLGLKQNVGIENAQLEKEKSQFALSEAKSKLYPQLEGYSDFLYSYAIPRMAIPGKILGQSGTVAVEFGTQYDWSMGLRANQMIYNKSYYTSLQIAEKMIRMNELSLQQKQEEIILQISRVYFLGKATEYQIEQILVSLQNIDSLLDITQLQVENQVILPIEYARIMVDRNNLQTEADQLSLLHQQQLDMLKFILNLSYSSQLSLTDTLNAGSRLVIDDFSKEQRLQVKLIDQQIDLANLDIKMNKQAYLPSVNLFANHFYQGMRDEFDFFDGGEDRFFEAGILGLNITVPIFDGFSKKQKRNQQRLTLQQLENNRKNTLKFFDKEYSDALSKYRQSQQVYHRQKENIKLAKDNYRVKLMGYREQVSNLTEVLLAESSLTQSKLNYFNALLQLKMEELNIDKLQGKLSNYINL